MTTTHSDDVPAGGAARAMPDLRESRVEADAAFREYLAVQRQRRRELLLITCPVLAVLAIFAWSSYRTLRSNFSHERVRASAERMGGELVREASPLMIDVARQVAPVYRAEAVQALERSLPELEVRARAEFELALANLSVKAKEALLEATREPLEEALGSLAAELPELGTAFPDAPGGEAFTDELLAQTEQALAKELDQLLLDAQAAYLPEVEGLLSTLRTFESSEVAALSTEELTQRFLHLWLVLIDGDLMGWSEDAFESSRELSAANEGKRG